jgi:hypothetical protein
MRKNNNCPASRITLLKLLIILAALCLCPSFLILAQESGLPSGYRLLYQTNFNGGLDPEIIQQKPQGESIMLVQALGGVANKCLQVTVQKEDDFSKVANGAPRSELSFGRQFRITPGRDYVINWSTFLPVDHRFDYQQLECITQIHQSLNTGSPPFMLLLNGDKYQVEVRGGPSDRIKKSVHPLSSAVADRGKWVKWRLQYRPDSTGATAELELFKNQVLVLDATGKPNAYADDTQAYLKMGIYKWDWQKKPSDVRSRKLFYGDIFVGVKETR